MIPLVLSNLTFWGKNLPSFNQLTYDPSLGIHPGCKQRTACFWVLETPRTAGESESSVLASELRSPLERPRLLPLSGHGLCHAWTYQNSVGMSVFLLMPLFGTTGSVNVSESGDPGSLQSPTLALCGSHSTTLQYAGKALAWPSLLWRTKRYLNEERKEAARDRMPEVLHLGTKGYFSIFCFCLY